jgi:hypothetical protein
VRGQAQAVKGGDDEVREAGGQLQGGGGHSLAYAMAGLLIRQTGPRPPERPRLQMPLTL